VIVALFATGFAIAVTGLALVVVAFLPLEFFYIPAFNHVSLFFAGIALTCLGCLFTIGTYYISKGFYIITVKYVKFNINIIRGRK
jgi:uncharacterized membrane protein